MRTECGSMSDEERDDLNPENATPAPQDEETAGSSEAISETDEAPPQEPEQAAEAEASAEAPAPAEDDSSAGDGDAGAEELAATALDAVAAALGDINASDDVVPLPRDEAPSAAPADGATPLELPPLSRPGGAGERQDVSLISDVALHVTIELGRTRMSVEEVLQLGDGAVVELDKLAGDPVDIFVNGRQVARGEVLVLNENLCVRVSEILDPAAQSHGEPARKAS
jgi:flagellar motor switch protein FliN/FliY